MKIYSAIVFLSVFLSFNLFLNGQTISSRVVDVKTKESIPYATIQLSENNGVIANEEGFFSIQLNENIAISDSLFITSMGYEKKAVILQSVMDSIIYLSPKAIELKEVFISNKNLTIDEIINNVENKLTDNYDFDLSKKKLFFRQSNTDQLLKNNIEFKKSTIKELNKDLIDSLTSSFPRNTKNYIEVLCDFYGNYYKRKINIVKSAKLFDRKNDGSVLALVDKTEKILKENIKQDSYLKIKSGFFLSTKVQVDSVFKTNEDAAELKDEIEKKEGSLFLDSRKSKIQDIFSQLFIHKDSKLNVIHKSGRYNFKIIDYTTIDDSSVYVIDFSPKRNEDFKGILYVNTQDFAIMRIDYDNVKSLNKFKLFGFGSEKTIYRGKTIFSRGTSNKYSPKYIEKEVCLKSGVNRPLKIIEKNKHVKGRRKQNELSLHLDVVFSNYQKYEIVIFDSHNISTEEYSKSKENIAVKPTILSKYDPEFWKGYTIMEPNTAIRDFSALKE